MIKNNMLIIIFGLCFVFNADSAIADTIELKDGRVFNVDCYWEKDGKIIYQKHGADISIEKSRIKKITDGSKPDLKIIYRDESEEKRNDLLQNEKKEYTAKSKEQIIVEGLLLEDKEDFPPNHDFEHNGVRYKFISPGVYRTENGTIYKTTRVSTANDKPFPPNHDFEYNGTRYKFIKPGVYQTENGTIYKNSRVQR